MFVIIVILVAIVLGLLVYNIKIYKKLKSFSNTNEKINSLSVLQDFMNIVGGDKSAVDKIQEINEKLIQKYNIQYSTIVTFNGAEYTMQATNIEFKYWDKMKHLHTEDIFKESIMKATPKYITVEKDEEQLTYQPNEERKIKSVIFFPLYIDNIYIGYWIIESGIKHAFDHMDFNIIDVVKENMIVVLKAIQYQNTMENIVRTDLFTGLNSAEYLYGQAKNEIDKYPTSMVCMLRITNLEEINKEFSREMGNNVIIQVSNMIKANIPGNYIFVRYMGPKFVLVFLGEQVEEVSKFVHQIKSEMEQTEVTENKQSVETEGKMKKSKKKQEKKVAIPKLNFVISTYYKGTGMESVTKKLEEYLDSAVKEENDINFI